MEWWRFIDLNSTIISLITKLYIIKINSTNTLSGKTLPRKKNYLVCIIFCLDLLVINKNEYF